MNSDNVDLLIVGGGINGAGIACDAAGRGHSVLLCEADDLASGTSSASSKMIHGGLRYLEHYEFRLVRKALAEREVMLKKAPHLVRPLRLVLPHAPGMRPAWMLRCGLFLYDHLYPRQRLPASAAIGLADLPLKAHLSRGFAYWDCWVDDARLVLANARAAADLGAAIETRSPVTGARVEDGQWQVTVRPQSSGRERTVRARALVNAAGPWAAEVLGLIDTPVAAADNSDLKLVKGSHIVVPRIAGADDGYLLQNDDGRVVFVLPFEDHYSLIGTTDVPYAGDPRAVAIDADEEAYLIAAVGRYFAEPPKEADIVWKYAGVRALFDEDDEDPAELSRDYHLLLSRDRGAPLMSVFGGKVTTYRHLSEQAMDQLAPHLPPAGPTWTADASLPGGDLPGGDVKVYLNRLIGLYPEIPNDYLQTLARRHGTLAETVLGDATSLADMGAPIGGGLYAREVTYMKDHEWARSADDVLWRRSKAGVGMTPEARTAAQAAIQALL